MTWLKWFAWYPVRTRGGRIVWMRKVERAWDNEVNPWGDASGHAGTDGGWAYRLPLRARFVAMAKEIE